MSASKPVTAGLAAAAALVVAGCASASAQGPPDPATLEPVAGSPVQQVRLTAGAMRRIGIETQAVQAVTGRPATGTGAAGQEVIPYSAVVYDTDGSTWTYVNTAARTFVRDRITITAIQGATAVLSAGPTAGAMVVTVGAPELLGVEYDISGEE